ncbi:hypothetical protein EUTSA_v10028285mg, partial [Eutrema salsugineum]
IVIETPREREFLFIAFIFIFLYKFRRFHISGASVFRQKPIESILDLPWSSKQV